MRLRACARDDGGASGLRERARLLGAHAEFGEDGDESAVGRARLRGEVEFEVGVGEF